MKSLELLRRCSQRKDAIAVQSNGCQFTCRDILQRSEDIAAALLSHADSLDLAEERVAFLLPAGADYVSTQWGIWSSGGIAVPLSLSATASELEYALSDSQAAFVVASKHTYDNVEEVCASLNIPILQTEEIKNLDDHQDREVENGNQKSFPELHPARGAMILYTSGTTSRPKGVVLTHGMIEAQIRTLVEAWQWQQNDRIPLFLPLHHIHGIINVLSCALWSGATVDAFPRFDMQEILKRVADGAYTVFMAVPTIYVKIISALEDMPHEQRNQVVSGFRDMRLMVSGSAALPESVHQKWTKLTGQVLLERYGMTEIGMGLSNPYDGQRRAGMVGQPLPNIEVRLKSEDSKTVVTDDNVAGEIQVRGPSVFQNYWNRPIATEEAFDEGWFRTGDIAAIEDGYFRILGRNSVDIIKSGGYKISALEIEASLLDHPDILECAVVGVADETWGESVAVAAVLSQNTKLELETLRSWCRDKLSKYKIPKHLLSVKTLPRNAMGKVAKTKVQTLFGGTL